MYFKGFVLSFLMFFLVSCSSTKQPASNSSVCQPVFSSSEEIDIYFDGEKQNYFWIADNQCRLYAVNPKTLDKHYTAHYKNNRKNISLQFLTGVISPYITFMSTSSNRYEGEYRGMKIVFIAKPAIKRNWPTNTKVVTQSKQVKKETKYTNALEKAKKAGYNSGSTKARNQANSYKSNESAYYKAVQDSATGRVVGTVAIGKYGRNKSAAYAGIKKFCKGNKTCINAAYKKYNGY